MSFQVTQEPNNQTDKILEDSSRKEKQAAPDENVDQRSNDVANQHQKDSAESRNDGSGQRILTNDRDPSQSLSPSTRNRSEENHVRPSSRKRRKISNYAQFIDVGASSSSDEGGQPN